MSMLRALDRSGGLGQRGPRPLGPNRRGGDLRRAPRRARRSPRRLPAPPAADRDRRSHHARRPRSDLPRLARAADLRLRPARAARRVGRPLGRRGRTGPAGDGALPTGDRRGRCRRRRGWTHRLLEVRDRGRERRRARRSSSPARRPGPSFPSAAGWGYAAPASAASAPARFAICAPARCTAPRAKWSAPASTLLKDRSRSRSSASPGYTHTYSRRPQMATTVTPPIDTHEESPSRTSRRRNWTNWRGSSTRSSDRVAGSSANATAATSRR